MLENSPLYQSNPSSVDRFCEKYCYNLCPDAQQCEKCVECIESPCPDFCKCCDKMSNWEFKGLLFSVKAWAPPLVAEIMLHTGQITCENSKGYDNYTERIISYVGLSYSIFIGLCSVCCLVDVSNPDRIERYKARRMLAFNCITSVVTIIWNVTIIARTNSGWC